MEIEKKQYKGSSIEKGMKPELEDLSFVDLCRVEKALKDNFEKGLMVESTFTGMSEKIDLAKAGKISQNGKLVPVHIIDKNGKHTVKWKNPEDAGNHKKVSQGHKVTYKGESHTVHKVKKDGYWTLVDENGKKHDKSPLRLEVHKPGEMGDGKSEAPKEENHKTTMINIVDNAMVAGDGDPIKDKLKRGDVEGAIKQARKVAKIREKLGHSDEVERATDLRGIADELEKKFLNRESKKEEKSETPKVGDVYTGKMTHATNHPGGNYQYTATFKITKVNANGNLDIKHLDGPEQQDRNRWLSPSDLKRFKKKEASEAPKRVAPNKRVTETKDMSLEQLEEKVGMFGKRDIPGFSAYTKSKALLDAFVKENSGKASPLLKKQYDTKFQMMSADRKTYIANLKKKVGEKPAQEAPKVKEPKKEEPKGDTAGELKSFLEKNKSHYASFLSPKRFSTSLNNDVLTIKPASGTFTIKVDTKNKTVETTGKPDFKSESTSYVEMMEGIKNRTKIKPENITDLSKTNKEEPKKEDDDSRKGSQENFIDEFISARVKENFKKKGMNVKKTLTNLAEFMDNNARAYKLANAGEFFNSDKVYTNFMRREGLARLRGGIQRDIHEFSRKYGDNLRNANS